MTLSDAIIIRLKALMAERNFSQYDFYTKGGIAKSTVSQILNGTLRKEMAISTLYQMLATMEVSLKDFFDDPIFDEVTD